MMMWKKNLFDENQVYDPYLILSVKVNILLILVDRSFSKQSSALGDDLNDIDDDEDDETLSDDPKTKKKKHCHTPFIFRMLKLNGPEWRWILLGTICSITYGAIQPLFALFFSQIYGLFAEPDLNEQKRLTSIYAGWIFLVGLV